MDVVANLITAVPVVLTLLVMQIIKIVDPNDKMKRFYFLVAVAIGTVIGGLFSVGLSQTSFDIVKIARDGVQNAIVAVFVYLFKKPLGIRFPGDTGFVSGKFFGYTE